LVGLPETAASMFASCVTKMMTITNRESDWMDT
jgi:hypothetical protein